MYKRHQNWFLIQSSGVLNHRVEMSDPTNYESYIADEVDWHECGIIGFIRLNLMFVLLLLPLVWGCSTLLFLYSIGVPINSGVRRARRLKKSQYATSFMWLVDLCGWPKNAQQRFERRLKEYFKADEFRTKRKVRHMYRFEWWLGKPALDVARLKRITVLPCKTAEEKSWLDQE